MSAPKLIFLLSLTLAYGASITPNSERQQDLQALNFWSYLTNNSSFTSNEDASIGNLRDYDPIAPSEYPVANPQNTFEVGKVIAEVSKRMVEIFSKVDLSDQSLQNLVQMILPLVSLYFGPYAQVIVPLLSGIAAVLIKSLASSPGTR